jgi:S1-C subfamily serine protease
VTAILALVAVWALPGLLAAQPRMSHDPRRGVVKILVEKTDNRRDVGAGVVVGFDENLALILTAAHVIDSASKIEVVFYDKLYFNYNATAFSRRNDDLDIGLVVLDLSQGPAVIDTLPNFSLGNSTTLVEGSQVSAIGHPLGSDWQTSLNTVVELSHHDDFRKLRFSNTRVDRGNSGGPLLDEGGKLIGMVLERAPLHAVAVRIDAVMAVLRAWRIPLNFLDMAQGGGNQTTASPAEAPPPETQLEADPATPMGGSPTSKILVPTPAPGAAQVSETPRARPAESPPTSQQRPGQTPPPDTTEPLPEPAVIFRPGAENPFNHVPLAVADGVVTAEDTPVVIHVLENDGDQDGDPLTVSAFARESEQGGTVATDGTLVTYIPPQDFHGSHTFAYGISDGNEGTSSASVTIAVTPVNDPPVIEAQELKVKEGETLEATVAATDPDGDPLTFTAEGLPEGATIGATTGVVRFTPPYSFSDSGKEKVLLVELVVTDGNGGEARQTSDLKVVDVPGGLDPGGQAQVALGGAHPVRLGFERVTAPGVASIRWVPATKGSVRPGYRLSGNRFLDLSATASFSGAVHICVDYSAMTVNESDLTLQRWFAPGGRMAGSSACEADEGCWLDLAAAAGDGSQLCASTDGLSRVALLERLQMDLSSGVVRKGNGLGTTVALADADSVTGATWSWGDGEITSAVAGQGSLTGAHQYSKPGLFEVELALSSASGAIGRVRRGVVVFDTEAGSFGGKARFSVAGLTFISDSLEWLVIADNLVAMQARGKVDKRGSYDLLVTARVSASGDKVRVRLRDGAGAVVYDSQPGAPPDAQPAAPVRSGRLKVSTR